MSSTAVPMPSVPATMIGVRELGSTRRKSRPICDSPSARDAMTKSCSRVVRIEARMMRAKMGIATRPMASGRVDEAWNR